MSKENEQIIVNPAYDYKKDEINFITQTKIDVLNLPVIHTVWIGAKYGGKTRPVVTRMLGMMVRNKDVYGLALKKYKLNATQRLHTAINNMSREIRLAGYDIPLVEKSIMKSILNLNPKNRDANQSIEYASLDDMDGLAGIEAPNLGLFGIVHLEEPVMSGDKEQPTEEEFDEMIKILMSSVNRSNAKYADIHGCQPYFPKYHYTMNAWDDHPLVTKAERHFPEDVFLNWCLGVSNWEKLTIDFIDANWDVIKQSLIDNNTSVVIDNKDSTAYVRNTMFANPSWASTEMVYNPSLPFTKAEQLENFWEKIKQTIIKKDYSGLAIYLGLKKQKSAGDKTYELGLLETGDTLAKIKKENWEILGTSQGWDVDVNRLLCNTPVVLARKHSLERGIEYKMFVLPQNEVKAYGDGGGRHIPNYAQAMQDITYRQLGEFTSILRGKQPQNGQFLYIDDNQGQWLHYFANDNLHIKGKAKKQGKWDILSRQNWLNQAMNSGFIMIDEKNKDLLLELKRSILTKSSDKRDESGGLNKYYDRINSMEYAIYPFHHWINFYLQESCA